MRTFILEEDYENFIRNPNLVLISNYIQLL